MCGTREDAREYALVGVGSSWTGVCFAAIAVSKFHHTASKCISVGVEPLVVISYFFYALVGESHGIGA